MNYFVLNKNNPNLEDFIDFWSQFYFNKNQKNYNKHIGKQELTQEELVEFSKWRNDSENLNQSWQANWSEIKEKIDILNSFKQQDNINIHKFRNEFHFLDPYWKTYLLHWCAPDSFLPFDQETFVAQRYLQFQVLDEFPHNYEIIEDFYFNHFIPDFFQQMPKQDKNSMKIYSALHSFGSFLINLK